jgi:hypothetical protein
LLMQEGYLICIMQIYTMAMVIKDDIYIET